MSDNSGKLFAGFSLVLLWDCIISGNTMNTKYRIKFEILNFEYLAEMDALIFLKKKEEKENKIKDNIFEEQ